MGAHDLIDSYLDELRDTLRGAPGGEATVEEMADHLLTATAALEAQGADPEAAQREALSRFGQSSTVARAVACGSQSSPALPTRSTVSGGTVPWVGAGMWVLYALATFAMIHLYDRVESDTSETSSSPLGLLVIMPWALGLMGAMGTLVVTAVVLKERQGGFHVPGWLGFVVLIAGTAASLIGWFIPGWGSLLVVGAALLALELLRVGVAPRAPTIALAVGPAVGFAVWGALRAVEIGSADSHGDFPVAAMAGIAVGCAILTGALLGLGQWLRNENPIELASMRPDESDALTQVREFDPS